ncbi:MAG: FapA family protein [Syntrophomonas sp.]|uniref:DUF342 domain-containing protein n=1 Tax=Syntrophomonas sp. TaxID=2053627 RepID=UPI002629E127|nr:FapA family protein [Syntrophomonas sp.]MDD2510038.1 FapA family protein [Syntrophomonas sp.]MDD3878624.1 FapA family protein [Syntrophomonas sp.]MDD4626085.1 FapA family protein [Syntrophomonas sp.]
MAEEKKIDGYVKTIVHKDMMRAFIEIIGPEAEGVPCSLEQVKKALAEKGVVYGINEEALQQAVLEENWHREILAAEGLVPVDGINASIIFKFPLPKERMGPKVDDKGNVDYHDLGLIYNVKKGTLLAERIPAVEGQPGINVMGVQIPPKRAKELRIPRGKNTIADNEERFLYAATDGHVTIIDNKVVIDPILQINGNIDYSTGDIDFIGNILISGVVNSGFKVKAEGDIEINGFIEGADVTAGGNIVVKGGITGGLKSMVKAGESIYARFIENSRVEARKDVIVKDAIMQSFVKAGGSVRVSDRKAIIVGGCIQAFQEVESKVLGSQLATQTVVEVGINPLFRAEYQKLIKQRVEKKRLFDNLSHNLQIFQRSGVSPDSLSENKRRTLLKMLDDFKNLRQELAEMEERIIYLEEEFEKGSMAKVKVLETVYPGVRVSIGHSMYIVNDTAKFTAFVLDQGEVKLTSLR